MSVPFSRILTPAALMVAIACGGAKSPTSPGTNGGDTITGSERLGWTQPADGAADGRSYAYAVYVDNVIVALPNAVCQAPVSDGSACSSALPPLTVGRHVLEVVAIDGSGLAGDRSVALTVTVVSM